MTDGTPEQPGYSQPGYGQQPGYGPPPGYGQQPGYGPAHGYGGPMQPPTGPGGPTTPDDRTWAMLGHIGTIIVGFVAPLVVFLVRRDQSPFCRHHGAQALNLAITQSVYSFVNVILIFLLIGLITFPVQIITWIVFAILAGLAANRGEYYRYPAFMAWPLIK